MTQHRCPNCGELLSSPARFYECPYPPRWATAGHTDAHLPASSTDQEPDDDA